jgi:hypothetical protein
MGGETQEDERPIMRIENGDSDPIENQENRHEIFYSIEEK